MSTELPPDLSAALHRLDGEPLFLVDPITRIDYVLIPAAQYRHSEPKLGGDEADPLLETFRAQIETAFAAGWSDPEMSDYDDYEAHRKALDKRG